MAAAALIGESGRGKGELSQEQSSDLRAEQTSEHRHTRERQRQSEKGGAGRDKTRRDATRIRCALDAARLIFASRSHPSAHSPTQIITEQYVPNESMWFCSKICGGSPGTWKLKAQLCKPASASQGERTDDTWTRMCIRRTTSSSPSRSVFPSPPSRVVLNQRVDRGAAAASAPQKSRATRHAASAPRRHREGHDDGRGFEPAAFQHVCVRCAACLLAPTADASGADNTAEQSRAGEEPVDAQHSLLRVCGRSPRRLLDVSVLSACAWAGTAAAVRVAAAAAASAALRPAARRISESAACTPSGSGTVLPAAADGSNSRVPTAARCDASCGTARCSGAVAAASGTAVRIDEHGRSTPWGRPCSCAGTVSAADESTAERWICSASLCVVLRAARCAHPA